MNLAEQFMLTEHSASYSGTHLAVAGSGTSPMCQEMWGRHLLGRSPFSRRDFLKVTGIGAGTVLGWGAFPSQSKAEPITLVSCIVNFLLSVFAAVTAEMVMANIRGAQWYRRSRTGADPEERFHDNYAPPDVTNTTIERVESQRYPNCYFDLNQVGRFSGNPRLDRFKDLNAPEYRRLANELRTDGPYRLVADPRASRRRRLTRRDLDLFDATLRIYATDSAILVGSEIVPAYARELCDSRGGRYTGFGLILRSGGKNFLIGNTSSA